jgi:hypothetical protein
MIDLAEDRDRFQKLLIELGLKQPENGIAYSNEQAADRRANRLPAGGAPVLCAGRPRHGSSCCDDAELACDIATYPNDKTGQIVSPA